MRLRYLCMAVVLWVGLSALVAPARNPYEIWRTPWGGPGFPVVNPANGSVWVLDLVSGQVRHLSATGAPLWSGPSLIPAGSPSGPPVIAVSSADGSVWVAESETSEVVHLSKLGVELWRTRLLHAPLNLGVNSADASCWADTGYGIVRLDANGVPQDTSLPLRAPAPDPTTGTIWGLGWGGDMAHGYRLCHSASDGTVLWQSGGYCVFLELDQAADTFWTLTDTSELARVTEDGSELWRLNRDDLALHFGWGVLNPTDGSLCTASALQAVLVGVTRDGTERTVPVPVAHPGDAQAGPAFNAADGSFWLALTEELPDGSGQDFRSVIHCAADGTLLTRLPDLVAGSSMSVDPTDGSLWLVAAPLPLGSGAFLFHFAEDGTELRRVSAGGNRTALDLRDGSCWPASEDGLSHYSVDGALLARIPEAYFNYGFAVDQRTGVCWVALCGAEGGGLVACDPFGRRLWRGEGLSGSLPRHVNDSGTVHVDARDGTVWIDTDVDQLVHLAVFPTIFTDILADYWAAAAIKACYEASLVSGYKDGGFHPESVVNREQMAVFLARALSDVAVPPGPTTPTFSDVGSTSWAYDHIEYVASQQVALGFASDGGYHPKDPVTRGAMAAFIARSMVPIEERPDLPSYVPPLTPTFPDVPAENKFYRYIEYVKEHGVANGYKADSRYHPEYACTRAQMAVFLAKAFGLL